jgi:hypothetical protein
MSCHLQVAHHISVSVADASTLSTADCLDWCERRPELWDTVSGPPTEADQPLLERLRALLHSRDQAPITPLTAYSRLGPLWVDCG